MPRIELVCILCTVCTVCTVYIYIYIMCVWIDIDRLIQNSYEDSLMSILYSRDSGFLKFINAQIISLLVWLMKIEK